MNQNTQTPAKTSEVEYVPYGAADKIKLSINIVQKLIAVPTKSGQTCSERDAMKFLMMLKTRKLNPFDGDAFLVGYDGKDGPQFSMITAHQAFLKRAELHPEYDGMESGVIVGQKDENGVETREDLEGDFVPKGCVLLGGWAKVYFKTRKYPAKDRLNLEAFRKETKFWNENPAGLIVKCAEASALRKAFPTSIGGLYLHEETGLTAAMPDLPPSFSQPFRPPLAVPDNPELEPMPTDGTYRPTLPPRPEPIHIASGNKVTVAEHEQFQQFLTANNVSFDLFRKWGEESGNIPDATSKSTLEEIDGKILLRLLKAKDGLLAGLEKMRSVAS